MNSRDGTGKPANLHLPGENWLFTMKDFLKMTLAVIAGCLLLGIVRIFILFLCCPHNLDTFLFYTITIPQKWYKAFSYSRPMGDHRATPSKKSLLLKALPCSPHGNVFVWKYLQSNPARPFYVPFM